MGTHTNNNKMKQLQQIQQGLKAPKNNRNDYGKYNYRKAEDILAAVKPMLGGCTITLSDEIVMIQCEEDRVVKVKTQQPNPATGRMMEVAEDRVIHVGGRYFLKATAAITDGGETATATGWAELDTHAGMSREQCAGAASSYARKYALCGLFGIDDSSSDPDAIDNRPRTAQPQPNPQQNPQQSPADMVTACNSVGDLVRLWNSHPQWHADKTIAAAFTLRKKFLSNQL